MSLIRQLFPSRSEFSEQFVGDPVEVGARSIRPVARVRGRRGAGTRLRAEPEGVMVIEGEGQEHRVPMPDRTRPALLALAGVGLVAPLASRAVRRILR